MVSRRPRRQPRAPLMMRRVYCLCGLIGLPGFCFLLLWLHALGAPRGMTALALLGILLYVFLLCRTLSGGITHSLRTLANVVFALREEDFSFRARGTNPADALGALAMEINSLADMLQQQRTQTLEATALLTKIVAVMDAPLFTFDGENRLRLINPAGERLLGKSAESVLGDSAASLGLEEALQTRDEAVFTLGSHAAKWMLRRTTFRQNGAPQNLLVLSDVSAPLQEEERQAWKRLIRVLGHELSNSLAPIKSIAESLAKRLPAPPPSANAEERQRYDDYRRGLTIIEGRADALQRFVQAYRMIAQLPPPQKRETPLAPLLERIVGLETRLPVTLERGPQATLLADPDQLEQMFINLVRNAVEASAQNHSARAGVGWSLEQNVAVVYIDDYGQGIANPENLVVPFYTTKPQGSGVGLPLARQIAHAHGGSLRLFNRPGAPGARAEVTLPLYRQPPA